MADSYEQVFRITAESDAYLINSFRTVHDCLLRSVDQPAGERAQLGDLVCALS
ncbi:hypothetical protein [Kitasatospora sp. NPDC058478]|uniref:hypothetical protein n=1 Tax=unclassified Kitasatospora TaxID=2633591 RepID=UPI00365D4879